MKFKLARLHTAIVVTGIIAIGIGSAALTNSIRTSRAIHPKSGLQIVVPGKDGDGFLLFNGWKVTPAGRHIKTGDFLMGGAFSPDGKTYAIVNAGYNSHRLHIIDVETEKEVATLPVSRTWNGIAWGKEGDKLYLSGGISNPRNDVHVFQKSAEGTWKQVEGLKLTGADSKNAAISGLALSKDGKTLFALNISDNRLYSLDIATGRTLSKIETGDHPFACALSADGVHLGVSNLGGGDIAVIDVQAPETLTVATRLRTGSHPNAFALSNDNRVFVACSNDDEADVFDATTGELIEKIKTTLTPKSPEGSSPNAVAISPDSSTLYVTNADNNDVCVIDVSKKGESKVKGFIPTGWYPTSLAITSDGKKLIVGTGKGTGTSATGVSKPISSDHVNGFKHMGTTLSGLLSFVDVPNEAKLAEYTAQVKANTPYNDELLAGVKSETRTAIPEKVGGKSPIKHVLYIIKENRTYDQVFGDLPKANGDPELCLFGRDVTPNHHALAEEFVTLDNLYCSGEVSADGHPWSASAIATDFVQKNWVLSYSAKGSIPGGDSVVAPRNGFIWDECKRKKLNYRSYGEYVTAVNSEKAPEKSVTGTTGLKGHVSETWEGFGRPAGAPPMRDTDRADAFIAEFNAYEKTGTLPQFMIMSLGEDHTRGTAVGAFTPKAAVASNDQALGKIVDTISHSKLWKETAIFVIEDDAQNGPDHVDSHRTVGLVISPYTKRGIVDSTMYQTTSFLRTMELILGLEPLSQYDAAATPLFKSFTNRANTTPYKLIAPRIDIAAKNKPNDIGARESSKLDFSSYDKADEQVLNKILWESVKGKRAQMPAPKHSVILSSRKPVKEDD